MIARCFSPRNMGMLVLAGGMSVAMATIGGSVVAQDGQAASTQGQAPASQEKQVAGACFIPPAKLSDERIKTFMADPAALLTKHPVGGVGLSNEVRGLAGSDLSTVDALLRIASTAGLSQRAAIGAGLSRAARICVNNRPDIAEAIQQKVALSNNQQLITAFLSGSGDVRTAALTAGAPGGGAVGGGATGGGPAAGAAGIGGGTTGTGGTDVADGGSSQSGGLSGFTRGGNIDGRRDVSRTR